MQDTETKLPEEAGFCFYVPVYVRMELDEDGERYNVVAVNVDDEVAIAERYRKTPWLSQIGETFPQPHEPEADGNPDLLKKLIADAEDGQDWPSWEFGF